MTNQHFLYDILRTCQYSQTLAEVADKLFVSKPYLSRALKGAETSFGVKLVERSKKPILLTKAGIETLKHLEVIAAAEDDLQRVLAREASRAPQPVNILVSNIFLEPMVLDLLCQRQLTDPQLRFCLNSAVENVAESNFHYDIIVGKRYLNQDYHSMPPPSNQVYIYISNHCRIYEPDKVVLPFKSEYVGDMNDARFVGINGAGGMYEYIVKSFSDLGIQLNTVAKVDNIADSLRMAKMQAEQSLMALASNYSVKQLGLRQYNLIELPPKMLEFENAVMYQRNLSSVGKLAEYLHEGLQKKIKEDADPCR